MDYGKTLLGLADFPIMGTNLTSATPRDAMERVFPTVNDCKMVAFSVSAREDEPYIYRCLTHFHA